MKAQPIETNTRTPEMPAAPSPAVLAVDDRPENLAALQQIFRREPVDLVTAESGTVALSKVLRTRFAVVLLDVRMPQLDGFRLASLLRGHQETANLPIIFLTALSDDREYVARGYDLGAVDYLSKPYDPRALLSKVRVFVDLDRERQQGESLIRELRQIQDELRASNRALEQFAAIASHDLREPVRAIGQNCGIIREKLGTAIPEDLSKPLEFAVRGADRLSGMVDGLLEFSRLRTRTARIRPVSLNVLMTDIRHSLACAIEETGGCVTWDELPTVAGDARLLTRLLQNLISNGLKYHRPQVPPEVSVTCGRQRDRVTISVRDNGIGVDPQHHQRIFELYRRLHTASEFSGLGIGLAACLEIARTHGSEIRVESALGSGSCFHFDLPLSDD